VNALDVLCAQDGYVAIDKPAGLLVIPGRGDSAGPCAKEILEAQLGGRVFVVHRLDRDTSGVLLFALDAPRHRALSMAFEAGKVEKHYLALAAGRLNEPVSVDTALIPARRGRMRPARQQEGGKKAVTLFRPLERFGGSTLLDAQPLTGRTHQIRVHLLSIGHPLLVDPQYGRPAPFHELKRTPLHAAQLTLPSLAGVSPAVLRSALPKDMAAALERLRGEPLG
jgi:tRNA pseudouridine32 synthase/23S rRNA pseudouridine746 synthase/23S rRNA pseudouridine955/2504/2580 synthase